MTYHVQLLLRRSTLRTRAAGGCVVFDFRPQSIGAYNTYYDPFDLQLSASNIIVGQ